MQTNVELNIIIDLDDYVPIPSHLSLSLSITHTHTLTHASREEHVRDDLLFTSHLFCSVLVGTNVEALALAPDECRGNSSSKRALGFVHRFCARQLL